MIVTICLLALIYLMRGKEVDDLVARVKDVDWRKLTNEMLERLKRYALKVGRVAARPVLQLYYVLCSDNTSLTDKVMIYAALIYIISPVDLLPRSIYHLLGILDDGAALLFVMNRVSKNITSEIDLQVDTLLDKWFSSDSDLIID